MISEKVTKIYNFLPLFIIAQTNLSFPDDITNQVDILRPPTYLVSVVILVCERLLNREGTTEKTVTLVNT